MLDPIKVCAHYKPKFGQGAKGGGLTRAQLQPKIRELVEEVLDEE